MAASGAKLVEVGATNRTHLADYERAITPKRPFLKVHPSNYRIEGFHEEVSSRELAALAGGHRIRLFYENQGSGALLPDDILVRGGEETTPASVSAGLDLVSCSGNDLLGAAQAGVLRLSGHRDCVRLRRTSAHACSASGQTGSVGARGPRCVSTSMGRMFAHREVPVLNMLTLPQAHLERRARKLRDRMDFSGLASARAVRRSGGDRRGSVSPGGGSLPTVELPTILRRRLPRSMSVFPLTASSARSSKISTRRLSRAPRTIASCLTCAHSCDDRDIETAATTLVACVKKAIAR